MAFVFCDIEFVDLLGGKSGRRIAAAGVRDKLSRSETTEGVGEVPRGGREARPQKDRTGK